MMEDNNIAAISTPAGMGGIAVIRVSGPDAVAIVDAHIKPFKESHSLKNRKSHTLTFGQFYRPSKSPLKGDFPAEEIIDEVVISLYLAPHSFTGENVVEISCHGSVYIQQQILETLTSDAKCRLANPGEFTRRAFENGRMDLSQAEAVADLIASQSAASHRVAMNQMKGCISKKLDALRSQLLDLTSLLELELDFSEEEVEFADRQRLINLTEEIANECERLSATFSTGNAIKNGIPVAIIGAPNVGKSTLLNALLKEDRAIVSDIQGTTRDLIEDTITLQGYLFRFIDTAGIRHTHDTIEQLGIERSMQAAQKAQIIILLTEPGVDYPTIETRPDQKIIKVLNKADKSEETSNSSLPTPNSSLSISALNNIGISELEEQLVAVIPHTDSQDVIITNLRHKQALDEASTSLRRALDALSMNFSGDLVAEDLRLANQSLGEILSGGTIGSQEVLNNIFAHFCIGK